jgi:hypothetical protein
MNEIQSWNANLQTLLPPETSSIPSNEWFSAKHVTDSDLLNQCLKYCSDLQLSNEEVNDLKKEDLFTIIDYTQWILYLNNTNCELNDNKSMDYSNIGKYNNISNILEINRESNGGKTKSDEIVTVKKKTVETDPVKLNHRQQQINIGKSTIEYNNYISTVPKYARKYDLRYSTHPVTPRIKDIYSTRGFNGQISKWRRSLHTWDNEPQQQQQQQVEEKKIVEQIPLNNNPQYSVLNTYNNNQLSNVLTSILDKLQNQYNNTNNNTNNNPTTEDEIMKSLGLPAQFGSANDNNNNSLFTESQKYKY